MKKMVGIVALVLAVLVSAPLAHAQKGKRIPRIGLLLVVKTISYLDDAFLKSLRELGYIEGENILIESRQNKGKIDVSKEMADFVRLKVDVIVVHGGRALKAAMRATRTIPIVQTYGGNLAASGLIVSVAKPGGNITGSYIDTESISGKRAELLLEALPKASRIAVLGHPVYPKTKYMWTVKAARKLGMKVQSVYVSDPKEFESAYAAMTGQKAGGVVFIRGPFTNRVPSPTKTQKGSWSLPPRTGCRRCVRTGAG